jgi:FlgD Ig-like domain
LSNRTRRQFGPVQARGRSNEIISGVGPETGGPRKVPTVESISPNPFNPTTNIRFSLDLAGPVKVDIFTLSGARVRALGRGDYMSAGTHTMEWNGRDDTGRELASGPYLVRIESPQGQSSAKLLLVK